MKGWEIVNQIKVMTKEGRNVSEIARKLRIDRKTVRKYRDMEMDAVADMRVQARKRSRKVTRFKEWLETRMEAQLEDGLLNAQALFHEAQKIGYKGSARTLRRFVSRYREKNKQRRIYKPFETDPGFQGMVDFGEKRKVWLGNQTRTVYFASMVLSYSRRKYTEWFDRPIDVEMFIQFHQNAFRRFEGVPQEMVYDQTKLAVIQEQFGEIEFNEAFYNYATFTGFKTFICNSRDPESKGKIEAVIKYIKHSFLLGRRFENLGDLISQWEIWLQEIGDAKPHETTGKSPLKAWEEERTALAPFKESAFDCRPSSKVQEVYKDGLVKVLGNRYSVPHTHHGKTVRIRVTGERIEVYTLERELLYAHWRCFDRGKRFVIKEHYEVPKEKPTSELAQEVALLFGDPSLPEQIQKKFPRHVREQYKRLLSLKDRFERVLLRAACERAMQGHCPSYKNIKAAAGYLSERAALIEIKEVQLEFHIEMPNDLGLEPRDLDYYEQALGCAL